MVDFFEKFKKRYYVPSSAYFRKYNFVYEFFANKLKDEACFVDKADLTELIDLCDKVLKNKDKSSELLPTRSGFFFGNTEYSDYYFNCLRDCKKQIKQLLSGFNEEEDVIFVIMDW